MRLLHTMLRVTDLDRSVKFYTDLLGMRLLRLNKFPEGRFTLAFLGYGDESCNSALELPHNWVTDQYQLGNAYGHIAIQIEDVYQACAQIKANDGNVVGEAGSMQHGSTILAFVKNPDGYSIELLSPK